MSRVSPQFCAFYLDFFDKGVKPQEETTTSEDGNEDTTDPVKTFVFTFAQTLGSYVHCIWT